MNEWERRTQHPYLVTMGNSVWIQMGTSMDDAALRWAERQAFKGPRIYRVASHVAASISKGAGWFTYRFIPAREQRVEKVGSK